MADPTFPALELGSVTDGGGNALSDRGFITISGSDHDIMIDAPNGAELARRIVASFNACAGIPMKDLETVNRNEIAFMRLGDLAVVADYAADKADRAARKAAAKRAEA